VVCGVGGCEDAWGPAMESVFCTDVWAEGGGVWG
jgi:hypothetical protein